MSEKTENQKTNFVVENEINPNQQQHGWLSPEGAFIVCEPDTHGECADYIYQQNKTYFRKKFGGEVVNLPTRTLLGKAGYIKIVGLYPDFYNTTGELTVSQHERLKKAGYEIPEKISLNPISLLPNRTEVIKKLEGHLTPDVERLINDFYKNPFKGFRTENLEAGEQIFQALSEFSTKKEKRESTQKWGILEIVWHELKEGRIALGSELYHHKGDSPKDYGAAWENRTVYVNTTKHMRDRIPGELQKPI